VTEAIDNVDKQPEQNSQAIKVIQQGGGFFALFGKIVFILLILGILASAGLVMAKGMPNLAILPDLFNKSSPTPSPSSSPLPSPSPTPSPSPEASGSARPKASVSSQIPLTQSIEITTNGKHYSLQAPNGWKLQQNTQNFTTTSTISSGNYALIIKMNAATEGVPCGFKDAPVKPTEMFPDVSGFTYDDFVEFSGSGNQLYRRVDISSSASGGKLFFAVCQKSATSKKWGQPTEFGFITYEIPYTKKLSTSDQTTLKTLDAIVASLKSK
jgi:hypothetical protein